MCNQFELSKTLQKSTVHMKVLLSAYACEPGKGSEPGIGWDVAREMAKYHDVWVIVWEAHRSGIEAEVGRNPIPRLHFVYYDLPWDQLWWQGPQKVHIHYYLWQIGVYFLARKLHREVGFDLVHHVTYVKYWSPSFLSLLPVPFIWGPVGGGESAPKAFWQDFSSRAKVYETQRNLARWIGERDPFLHLTARRSVLARATTEETADRLHKMGARNVQVFSQVSLSKEEITCLVQDVMLDSSPVRFISVGRLLHWKGFHLGLRAFAQANLPDDAEYWIVGDGPEREDLQVLAKELNIDYKVKFWLSLPRHETLQKLQECMALVHPSLHESGGLVCLEAMAMGRPVVCLDLGGPAAQVTEETGFKIPAHTPKQAVADIAEAMSCLAKEPKLRVRMGHAGQRRVSEVFDWKVKGLLLSQLYEEILTQRQETGLTNMGSADLRPTKSS